MNLCSNGGHEEVCFESNNCPVCESLETVKDLEKQIEKLEREVASLNGE